VNLPPVLSLGFPRSAPKFLPLAEAESPKRGEYITVFREAKQVLRTGIAGIVDRRAGEMRTPVRHSFSARACKLPRHPSLASSMVRFICAIRLTNFFDLSNIRVEPWGASEMLGSRDGLEKCLFNSMGNRRWELICSSRVFSPLQPKMFSSSSQSSTCRPVHRPSLARFAV